jgi:hypothetical protein
MSERDVWKMQIKAKKNISVSKKRLNSSLNF